MLNLEALASNRAKPIDGEKCCLSMAKIVTGANGINFLPEALSVLIFSPKFLWYGCIIPIFSLKVKNKAYSQQPFLLSLGLKRQITGNLDPQSPFL
jgi:hypothetical protein